MSMHSSAIRSGEQQGEMPDWQVEIKQSVEESLEGSPEHSVSTKHLEGSPEHTETVAGDIMGTHHSRAEVICKSKLVECKIGLPQRQKCKVPEW